MTLSILPTEKISYDDFQLGVIGSAVSLSTGYVVMETSAHLMKQWGLSFTESQTFFPFYETLSQMGQGLLRGVLKLLAVVYVILIVPIVEEWFFRDLLYSFQERGDPHKDAMGLRVYRVISNGVVFGAFHVSLFQGWANIPILTVTTVTGIIFATLREMTGNIRASTVAHSLNNSFFMLMKYIKP